MVGGALLPPHPPQLVCLFIFTNHLGIRSVHVGNCGCPLHVMLCYKWQRAAIVGEGCLENKGVVQNLKLELGLVAGMVCASAQRSVCNINPIADSQYEVSGWAWSAVSAKTQSFCAYFLLLSFLPVTGEILGWR